ncbi:MAG: DUF134 domain-containing protein [Dehalococcoidales bacterium]|nr:DUF134 domain-containing protein [Dehalococcoidales bacterium]
MARPFKCRRVSFVPGVTYFKPAGIPLVSLGEIRLSLEEIEALRLKDIEGLEQEQGAEMMNISRPTFQRVLVSARKKVTDALLNGKAIKIEGGNFKMAYRRFRCQSGHEWEVEVPSATPPALCPTCNTPGVQPVLQSVSVYGRGRAGRHHGRTSCVLSVSMKKELEEVESRIRELEDSK